uniref:Uncharacterized protein n=1 Tax=Trypanosoma congolense (strain IL3000) TaxID=1068625 RepID=G0UKZ7_TRYCI|nr:hypothetical protein, unlikely [Trypanosoma congolense IL3000]
MKRMVRAYHNMVRGFQKVVWEEVCLAWTSDFTVYFSFHYHHGPPVMGVFFSILPLTVSVGGRVFSLPGRGRPLKCIQFENSVCVYFTLFVIFLYVSTFSTT